MSKYIYFNGFWGGFLEKTNPVHCEFFIDLLKEVYSCDVKIGELENSTILIENTQVVHSVRTVKQWEHTYLFSGESYLHKDADKYDCVLFGNRTHKNTVNTPLFVPYLYCSKLKQPNIQIKSVPENDVLCVISNPNGKTRNRFLDALEKEFTVTYAGHYRNNTGRPVPWQYNSQEFLDYVSSFKFVITMENSIEETYITEKITHGLFGGCIPVYWGSPRVKNYFNKERFLCLESDRESEINALVQEMKSMTNEKWLTKVNSPLFTSYGKKYTLQQIAKQVKNLLFESTLSSIREVIFLCNKEFEPIRYEKLIKMCNEASIPDYKFSFISSTFKHTITDEMMKKYVVGPEEAFMWLLYVRQIAMKKAEISLFLNYLEALEYITNTYSDGMFLVFESDVFMKVPIHVINEYIEYVKGKDWDLIHIGGDECPSLTIEPFYNAGLPARKLFDVSKIMLEYMKDLESKTYDTLYAVRKFHTRCTDSFLWSFRGCEKFYIHMIDHQQYCLPFDYYMTLFFEENINFKNYWSIPLLFDQASNRGLDKSEIQNDKA